MGLAERLAGQRVYLDANIFVYILEGFPKYKSEMEALLAEIDSGSIDVCTSELTLAEVLVKPIADGNETHRSSYESLLTSPQIRLCPVTRSVLIRAAELRARHETLRLPDAIHVGTAIQEKCGSFLTNDLRLGKLADVSVVLLDQS